MNSPGDKHMNMKKTQEEQRQKKIAAQVEVQYGFT